LELKEKKLEKNDKRIIYPYSSRGTIPGNPYILQFAKSLSKNVKFLNIKNPSGSGIFDIFKYISKLDIVFLNWVEDLPEKKGGIFQVLIFYLLLLSFKIKRIQYSTRYTTRNHTTLVANKIKQIVKKSLIKNADYILCHSSEGSEILKYYNVIDKTMIIHHPFVLQMLISKTVRKNLIF
jgi:hypothetical protein